MPTEKQKTCPHPRSEIVFLPDNIAICHHCYGLLDENLQLVEKKPVEEDKPAERSMLRDTSARAMGKLAQGYPLQGLLYGQSARHHPPGIDIENRIIDKYLRRIGPVGFGSMW